MWRVFYSIYALLVVIAGCQLATPEEGAHKGYNRLPGNYGSGGYSGGGYGGGHK